MARLSLPGLPAQAATPVALPGEPAGAMKKGRLSPAGP